MQISLNLKNCSIALLAIGILSLLRATFFDTAPEGTHNMGLMQEQILWSNFSTVTLIIGAILFATHVLKPKTPLS